MSQQTIALIAGFTAAFGLLLIGTSALTAVAAGCAMFVFANVL